MKKLGKYIVSEWHSENAVALDKKSVANLMDSLQEVDEAKGNLPNRETPDIDDVRGKDEEDNGSNGVYSVDAPTDDQITQGIDKETLTKNKKRILMRLKADKPFFIQGEAGWGKTSIITDIANRLGMTVITVFLDKCEAVDLGGIPVPTKSSKGADSVKHLMPEWASMMYDNPKTKFLLFFDEMNQAAPDVMNALMPIVLKTEICGKKFHNFVVGAAGNFEHENSAVSELSAPLKSRFGGIITWESGNWEDAFKHLRKKWKDKISNKFFDQLEDAAGELFKNPRDVESFIIESVAKLKEAGDADFFDTDDYYDQLKDIAKDDLTRTGEQKLKSLAETMHKFVNNIMDDDEPESGSRKNREMVPDDVVELLKMGMKNGFILDPEDNTTKYGISRENILKIEGWDFDNREMLERTINKLEEDGVKFKYEKDEEWKKAGFKDPNED